MKTDTLFYRLFKRWPELVLELLALKYSGDSYRFGSEEIKQTAFRIDGIFTPLTDDPEQPIIFVEVQYQPDEDFYARFFSEITLYLRLHKLKRAWLALVIYPNRQVEKKANDAFKPFTKLPQLHTAYLSDYENKPGQSPVFEFIRLIACQEKQTISLAQDLAQRRDELGAESLDFIETILVYKLPNLSREEIRAMLALNDIELKQTRFYQEIAKEEQEIGMEKGFQSGAHKGRVILLCHLFQQKFGNKFRPPDLTDLR
jgi:predicted transposase/invertase (TIGR01784 family)